MTGIGTPRGGKRAEWIKVETQRENPQEGNLSGYFEITLAFEKAVHVGSGRYGKDNKGMYTKMARRGDKVVIPGSSVRGAVRTLVEILGRGCNPGQKEGPRERCTRERMCRACRLFGTLGYRHRVWFSDFHLESSSIERSVKEVELNIGSARRGDGWKVYCGKGATPLSSGKRVEVVKEGCEFKGRIYFTNVSEEELGLLIRALGLRGREEEEGKDEEAPYPVFSLQIGSNRSTGYGRANVSLGELVLFKKVNGKISKVSYDDERKRNKIYNRWARNKKFVDEKNEEKLRSILNS